jgi:ribosomal protein S28E/S33
VDELVVVIDLRGISGQLMEIRLRVVIARERSRHNI